MMAPASVASGRVVIAHRDTVIESGDHVIIFCVRKETGATRRKAVPGRLRLPLNGTVMGRYAPVYRALGMIIMLFALTMRIPLAWSLHFE